MIVIENIFDEKLSFGSVCNVTLIRWEQHSNFWTKRIGNITFTILKFRRNRKCNCTCCTTHIIVVSLKRAFNSWFAVEKIHPFSKVKIPGFIGRKKFSESVKDFENCCKQMKCNSNRPAGHESDHDLLFLKAFDATITRVSNKT